MRDAHIQRQTETETDRQKDRQTDRTDRQTDRQRDRQTEVCRNSGWVLCVCSAPACVSACVRACACMCVRVGWRRSHVIVKGRQSIPSHVVVHCDGVGDVECRRPL